MGRHGHAQSITEHPGTKLCTQREHQQPTWAGSEGLAESPGVISGLRKKSTLSSQVKQHFGVQRSRGDTGIQSVP